MAIKMQASGDPTVSASAWVTLQKRALCGSHRQFPHKGTVSVIFLIAVNRYLRRKGGRICFGLQLRGQSPSRWGQHGSWDRKQLVTLPLLSGNRKNGCRFGCSARLPAQAPAHWMVCGESFPPQFFLSETPSQIDPEGRPVS